MVQSSRRHLLEHRLAGRHGVATVVTDGRGGGDLAGALAVTHWQRNTQTVRFTRAGSQLLRPVTIAVI